MEGITHSCTTPECTVGETGLCLQGHEVLPECPTYAKAEAPPPGPVDLPSALELTTQDTTHITCGGPTRVVVVAGPHRSGKTTLITSIYESLQQAPFADMLFAGSKTLHAFERTCHPSRLASDRETEDTERTKLRFDTKYLHLKLRHERGLPPPIDVLFADAAGERFRLARDHEDEAKQLVFLHRADHLAILVNGVHLAALETRTSVLEETFALVRSLVDASMIGGQTQVQMVLSKYDLIEEHPDKVDILEAWSRFEVRVRGRFSSVLGALAVLGVASRPGPGSSLPLAYRVNDLLSIWVDSTSQFAVEDHRAELGRPPTSEFEKFQIT